MMGSSVAMMETEVLNYKAPLYGRRTGQWKLQPLAFQDVRKFRPGKSFGDHMHHFAAAGGTPAYWLWLSRKGDFFNNLKSQILTRGEPLYDEVEFILREELREPRFYFSLLQSIALGKRRLGEIVKATGISQPVANKYLGVLSDLDIIEREIPVTEEKPLKSKKGLYRFKDEFIQFWFKFVFPRRGQLEMGQTDKALEEIKAELPVYLSFIYEKIAAQIIRQRADLFFEFEKLGRWWDKNQEIDLVGLNRKQNSLLLGEVKWSRNPVGVGIFNELKRKAQLVSWGDSKTRVYYVLFSRSGFTPEMIKLARYEKISLYKGDRICLEGR